MELYFKHTEQFYFIMRILIYFLTMHCMKKRIEKINHRIYKHFQVIPSVRLAVCVSTVRLAVCVTTVRLAVCVSTVRLAACVPTVRLSLCTDYASRSLCSGWILINIQYLKQI